MKRRETDVLNAMERARLVSRPLRASSGSLKLRFLTSGPISSRCNLGEDKPSGKVEVDRAQAPEAVQGLSWTALAPPLNGRAYE